MWGGAVATYNAKNRKKSKQQIRRTFGIALIAVSLLLLLFTTTNWLYFVKSFFLGVFGVMFYPLLVVNVIVGLGLMSGRRFIYSAKYIVYVSLSFLCVMALFHIALTNKLNDANYFLFLGDCYDAKFTPGGLLIGLFTYPVTSLLNDAAGYVLFSIILVILIAMIVDYLYAFKQFARLNQPLEQEEDLTEEEMPSATIPTSHHAPQENVYFEQEFEPAASEYATTLQAETQPAEKQPAEKELSSSEIARRRLGLDKSYKEPEKSAGYPQTYEEKKAYILNEDKDAFNTRTFGNSVAWLNRDAEQPKEPESVRPPKYVTEEDTSIKPIVPNAKKEAAHNRTREYLNTLYNIEGNNQSPIINADSYKQGSQISRIQPAFNNNNGIISSIEDFNKPKIQSQPTENQTNNTTAPTQAIQPKVEPPKPAVEPIKEPIKQTIDIKIEDTVEDLLNSDSVEEPKPIETAEQPKKVSPLNPISFAQPTEQKPVVETVVEESTDIITTVEDIKKEEPVDIMSSLKTTFNLPSSLTKSKEAEKEMYEQTIMLGAEKPKKQQAPRYRKPSNYIKPPIDLLTTVSSNPDEYQEEQQMRIAVLESKLEEFNIPAKVIGVRRGSAVTRYELQMPIGISVKKISSHSDDIAMALAANGDIRIEAPIRGKNAFGIEVPNATIDTVGLRDVIESQKFANNPSPLVFALGKDVDGNVSTCNLAKAPHLLVAGSTGSGKSVCLNALIVSLLYKTSPEDLKFILVDPKRVEFGVFNHLPHMLIPKAITDPKKALNAFDWTIMEMERRYVLFEENYVKNIEEYNSQPDVVSGAADKLPYIVLIVDEFADLLLSANKKELEERVRKLTAKARAAGIHLILATQRPSVEVVTGTIKLNLPTRIAFAVTNYQDSKTILDQGGAEKLLGKGDMLFSMQNQEPSRIQGAFLTTKEVVDVVKFIKENNESFFDDSIQNNIENMEEESPQNVVAPPEKPDFDPLLPKCLKFCIETNQASISMLQRRFSIGFTRSGRIIDQMEKSKFIGSSDGGKTRNVYINMEQFYAIFGEVSDD